MANLQSICFNSVKDNAKNEFVLSVTEATNTDSFHRGIKQGWFGCNWLYRVPIVCTVFNRPSMIASLREIIKTHRMPHESVPRSVKENNLVRFAKTLNYEGCAEELLKLYAELPKENKNNTIINVIFYLSKTTGIDTGTLVRSIKALYYIDSGASKSELFEKEVLAEAVSVPAKPEHVAALFDIGFDINAAFPTLCIEILRFTYFLGNTDLQKNVKLMEVFLQENPSVEKTKDAATSVLRYDLRLYRHACSTNLPDAALNKLRLAPLLHAQGYDFACWYREPSRVFTDCNLGPGHSKEGDFQSRFSSAISALLETPRSLKDLCRIVLRQHYTVRNIHRYVATDVMPSLIKDYLLFKDLV